MPRPSRCSPLRSALRLALLASLSLSSLTACGDLSPEEHLARARGYSERGQVQAAAIELKNALQKAPALAEARQELGLLYLRAGDGAAAEKELRQAIRLGVPEASLLVPLTRALILQEQFAAVIDQAVQEAAASEPVQRNLTPAEEANLLALRGHAYLALGRQDRAAEFYTKALAIQPDNAEAGLGEARLAGLRGDLKAVRAALEKTLEVNASFAAGWSLLGDLERYQGNLEAAEEAYRRAIEHQLSGVKDHLHRALVRIARDNVVGAEEDIAILERRLPRSAAGPYLRGLVALKKKDMETAERALREALSRSPDYLPAVYYAGLVSAARGRFEQAEQHLARYLGAHPDADQAAKLLAALRRQSRDYKGVEAVLKPVLARNPTDPVALQLLGDAALVGGRPDEAIDYFQKLVGQEAESSRAYLKLGLGMLAAGQETEGLEAVERAAELEPETQVPEHILFNLHLRAKRYAEALEVAERLRTEKPGEPLPPSLIGTVKWAQGDEAGARRAFEESLQLKPGFPLAAHTLALLDIQAGQVDAAKRRFQEALVYEPRHLGLLLGLADLEERVGDVEGARRTLETVVQYRPEAPQPRILLARHYTRLGQPEKALGLLKAVAEQSKDDPVFLAEMGKTLLAGGKPELAVESFRRLVLVAPKSGTAHYMLARTLMALGDAAGARIQLEQVLRLAPGHYLANVAYSRFLIQDGKLAEAELRLQGLQAQQPTDGRAVVELRAAEAELALRRGDPERAVSAYQAAYSARPSSELAVSLAMAQLARQDIAGAIGTLESWIEGHRNDARAIYGLGALYSQSGDVDKALSAYERVIALSPDNVRALNNAAWLLRGRDAARAAAYAEKALQWSPDDPAVLDTAGVVHLDTGKTARAVALLERAVERAPESASSRFHLVQALAADGQRERAAATLSELLNSGASFPEREEAKTLAAELGAATP